jgi:hypothetical protein
VADKVANFKAQTLSTKSTCKNVLLEEKRIKHQKNKYKKYEKAKNQVTSNLKTRLFSAEKYFRLAGRNIMLGPGNKSNWHQSSCGSSYKGLNTNHLHR